MKMLSSPPPFLSRDYLFHKYPKIPIDLIIQECKKYGIDYHLVAVVAHTLASPDNNILNLTWAGHRITYALPANSIKDGVEFYAILAASPQIVDKQRSLSDENQDRYVTSFGEGRELDDMCAQVYPSEKDLAVTVRQNMYADYGEARNWKPKPPDAPIQIPDVGKKRPPEFTWPEPIPPNAPVKLPWYLPKPLLVLALTQIKKLVSNPWVAWAIAALIYAIENLL